MRSIFLFLLVLSSNACALEGDPFGVDKVTSVDVELDRKKIIKEIGNGPLSNIPARVEMTKAFMVVKVYTWPSDSHDMLHALVMLFYQQNRKFSQNICEYLEAYPASLIGTVYVEYHTILEYEQGKKLETDLEFKEKTECQPGLEKYFQRKYPGK
jgi:hypothetical protein